MDITRAYGAYRMKLTPHIKLNRFGEIIDKESFAQVSVSDISLRLPLLWSKSFPLTEAQAAMILFESIGYYPIM